MMVFPELFKEHSDDLFLVTFCILKYLHSKLKIDLSVFMTWKDAYIITEKLWMGFTSCKQVHIAQHLIGLPFKELSTPTYKYSVSGEYAPLQVCDQLESAYLSYRRCIILNLYERLLWALFLTRFIF